MKPKRMADKPSPPASLVSHILNLDSTISTQIHALSTALIPRAALTLLEISGDGRLWFPLSIALLLSPLSLHSPNLHSFFTTLLIGLLTDIAIVGTTKHLVRRPRPIYNQSMGPTFAVDHWSFPSGHASRVCFVAWIAYLSRAAVVHGFDQMKLAKVEILERWIGDWDSGQIVRVFVGIGLAWAVVTSMSRVFLGRHFVFDVVVGAFLGVANAFFVYHYFGF